MVIRNKLLALTLFSWTMLVACKEKTLVEQWHTGSVTTRVEILYKYADLLKVGMPKEEVWTLLMPGAVPEFDKPVSSASDLPDNGFGDFYVAQKPGEPTGAVGISVGFENGALSSKQVFN